MCLVTPYRGRRLALISLVCSLTVFTPFGGFAAQSVMLAWDQSPETNIAGYYVHYGLASRTYTNAVSAGTATSVTVFGLEEGTTYYFAATCYNDLGLESDYSNEVSYTVPTGNQPPTLNALPDLTINENAGLRTVSLSGIGSGATNEVQTLTVTASSSNPGLIPGPTVSYTSPNATGSISFTPAAYAYGSATLTVTVNDGAASNSSISRTFTVTVNRLPTISAISNLVIAVDTQTPAIPFTVSDAETASTNLTVTGASSNQALARDADIIFGGTGTHRSVTVRPSAGPVGITDIAVSVSDGAGIATTTFQLSVKTRPSRTSNVRITQAGP